MGRNVKDALAPIVKALADRSSIPVDPTNYSVFVEPAEYEAIERRQIQCVQRFHPTPSSYFALYLDGTSYYFVESGFPEASDPGFKGIDNSSNRALFFLFLADSNIGIRSDVSGDAIKDRVFLDETKNGKIRFEIIEEFFPVVNIYEAMLPVPNGCEEYSLKQMSLKYICATYTELEGSPISFSSHTLSLYDSLTSFSGQSLPIDNLIQSILAYKWNFVFLDLYRCVERLYIIGWVRDYADAFGSSMPNIDIYEKLNEKRIIYHENEAIQYLFDRLPLGTLSILDGLRLGDIVADNNQAVFVYKLRNRIVHYQSQDIVSFSDGEWNIIISFLLHSIDYLYQALQKEINEIGDKTKGE